ncbi:hypothetical protein MBLNU230_g3725t1 [Neophaeotheca triangularis]
MSAARDQKSPEHGSRRETESSPLLPKAGSAETQTPTPTPSRSRLYLVLLTGFLVSLSFGVTQVPLIWIFRVMTCEAYYKQHPDQSLPGSDRCSIPQIEAATARAVSLLGMSTTFFGMANLFLTGSLIKKYGVKTSLAIQVFWPAVRLAVQNVGVEVGGGNGIIIIQCSQIITIVGGPVGYLLALNNFVTEVTSHQDRTPALGRLQGCTMFGSALGFLAGGLLSDGMGTIWPFRVTLGLFVLSTLYVVFCLPHIAPDKAAAEAQKDKSALAKFFQPLKTIMPRKWVLADGRIKNEYGALVLAIGVFMGVLATGYIPTLLQMYATDVFQFGTTENSYLVSMHSLLRGLFLTMLFPRIISTGREWMKRRSAGSGAGTPESTRTPTRRQSFDVSVPGPLEPEDESSPDPPKRTDKEETFEFDLVFTKFSLLADGLLTGGASFVRQGWQMYIIAVLLPLGAGTASAAKGTILQMCSASERTDALSAIALVEMIARLSTTFIFGLVFAGFASIGQTYLVFVCNAGVALVGFVVLLLSRFPPHDSQRLEDAEQENENET